MFPQVRQVNVGRQAFEGMGVENSFSLSRVDLPSVPPFAFSFDQVGAFTLMESRVGRVSMRGFRMDECGEFNVLKGNR